jgi:hypothetical protein
MEVCALVIREFAPRLSCIRQQTLWREFIRCTTARHARDFGRRCEATIAKLAFGKFEQGSANGIEWSRQPW